MTQTRKDVGAKGRTKTQQHGEAKERVKRGREENKEQGTRKDVDVEGRGVAKHGEEEGRAGAKHSSG
jgi:hypothetical protein